MAEPGMGAEIFLHSAWDAYCERLPLPKERGRIDPMAKADPIHLGRDVWHLGSVVDSITTAEERMVGNGYFRCADDLLWAMGLSWSNTVGPMLDGKGFLPVSRTAELLALIESHPLTNERLASGLAINANALRRQRELLLSLLRRSIELREPLEVIVFEGGPPNA
jgi:hypothetical protein